MRLPKLWPGWLVILMDLLLIGVTLNVFALFHHVLPQSYEGSPLQNMVLDGAQPDPSAGVDALSPTPEKPQPTPDTALLATPEPSPSPTPEPGDFSAAFPSYDTGAGALFSHQTDDIRIAVTQNKRDQATYYVADVWIRNIRQFKTAFAVGDEFKRGSKYARMPLEIANNNQAMVALTGDYSGARSRGVVIRNGTLYRESVAEDVCVLYADGVMETCYRDEFDLEAAIARGAYQSWSFGPKLLDSGQRPSTYDGASENLLSVINNRDPRAAIGYYAPGHYCLVVVDGRQGEYSRGMSLTQLSDLFIELGCTDAYNLDGGQTAAMVFDGTVVNRPYKDGRIISDIIYFGG